LFCSVFGVYVLFCSVFGMVVCSVFGQAGSPSLSSGLGQEGVFMNTCSCFVRVRVRTLSACSCFVCVRVRVHCVRVCVRVRATFCFVRNPVRAERLFVFGQQCSLPALVNDELKAFTKASVHHHPQTGWPGFDTKAYQIKLITIWLFKFPRPCVC